MDILIMNADEKKLVIKTGKKLITIHVSAIGDDDLVAKFKETFNPGFFAYHYTVQLKRRPELLSFFRSRGYEIEDKGAPLLPPPITTSTAVPTASLQKKWETDVPPDLIKRGLECLKREEAASRPKATLPPPQSPTKPLAKAKSPEKSPKKPSKKQNEDELSIRLYSGKDKKAFMKVAKKLNKMCKDNTGLAVPDATLWTDEEWEDFDGGYSMYSAYWNIVADDMLKKPQDREFVLYLARKSGKIVGFYLLETSKSNSIPEPNTFVLHLMCVPETQRGQRIGTHLLTHLKDKVLKKGDYVHVETSGHRIPFYERNGFFGWDRGRMGSYTGGYEK